MISKLGIGSIFAAVSLAIWAGARAEIQGTLLNASDSGLIHLAQSETANSIDKSKYSSCRTIDQWSPFNDPPGQYRVTLCKRLGDGFEVRANSVFVQPKDPIPSFPSSSADAGNFEMKTALLLMLRDGYQDANYESEGRSRFWNDKESGLDGGITLDAMTPPIKGNQRCFEYSRRSFSASRVVTYALGSVCGTPDQWTFNTERQQDKRPIQRVADNVFGKNSGRERFYAIKDITNLTASSVLLEFRKNKPPIIGVLYANSHARFQIMIKNRYNDCGTIATAYAYGDNSDGREKRASGTFFAGDFLLEQNFRPIVLEASKRVRDTCPQAETLVIKAIEDEKVTVTATSQRSNTGVWAVQKIEYSDRARGGRPGGFIGLMSAVDRLDEALLDASGVTYSAAPSTSAKQIVLCNSGEFEARVAASIWYCRAGKILQGISDACFWRARGWSHFNPGQCKQLKAGVGGDAYLSIQRNRSGAWRYTAYADAVSVSELPKSKLFSGAIEPMIGCGDPKGKFSIAEKEWLGEECADKYGHAIVYNAAIVNALGLNYRVDF